MMPRETGVSDMNLNRRRFAASVAAFITAPRLIGADGAVSLFSGRDLSGWHIRHGPESAFYVSEGVIAASPSSAWPAWLSTDREYENFELSCEVLLKGWTDGGIYLNAPEHGSPSDCGLQIKLFHQLDKEPKTNSMGSVFPVVAPKRADVHKSGEWNRVQILHDWPALRVWINGEVVQDLRLDTHPELSRRLRRGPIGLITLGYPFRFRNLSVRELPTKLRWTTLFQGPEDMHKWFVSESSERAPVRFEPYGHVLRADGIGHIATKEIYRDFELQLYIRGARHHNGGVLFRSAGKGLKDPRRYEVQLHDVPEAHFPTGSLYYLKRSKYPNIRDEEWFLFQLAAQGKNCWVRVDGETVLEYEDLKDLEPGHIELQAHQAGRWLEFKRVQIKPL
jgi:hypothetical protein